MPDYSDSLRAIITAIREELEEREAELKTLLETRESINRLKSDDVLSSMGSHGEALPVYRRRGHSHVYPNARPLAQDHAVALQVPDVEQYFFHDAGMARMDDGALIVAAPQAQYARFGGRVSSRVARSDDGGQTWDELEELPYFDATPFVVDGRLFMFVQEKSHRDFQIVTTEEGGRTWTPPVTVLEAPVWNVSTPILAWPDTIYWAMDYSSEGQHCYGKAMARLDRGKSPLDPEAWSLSNVVPRPDLPDSMTRKLYPMTDEELRRSPF